MRQDALRMDKRRAITVHRWSVVLWLVVWAGTADTAQSSELKVPFTHRNLVFVSYDGAFAVLLPDSSQGLSDVASAQVVRVVDFEAGVLEILDTLPDHCTLGEIADVAGIALISHEADAALLTVYDLLNNNQLELCRSTYGDTANSWLIDVPTFSVHVGKSVLTYVDNSFVAHIVRLNGDGVTTPVTDVPNVFTAPRVSQTGDRVFITTGYLGDDQIIDGNLRIYDAMSGSLIETLDVHGDLLCPQQAENHPGVFYLKQPPPNLAGNIWELQSGHREVSVTSLESPWSIEYFYTTDKWFYCFLRLVGVDPRHGKEIRRKIKRD